MAPAKIEFLKMALPSYIGGVRQRLPHTDNKHLLRRGRALTPRGSKV